MNIKVKPIVGWFAIFLINVPLWLLLWQHFDPILSFILGFMFFVGMFFFVKTVMDEDDW